MKKLLTIGLMFAMALSIGLAFAQDSTTTTTEAATDATKQAPMYGPRGMGMRDGMMDHEGWGRHGGMMRQGGRGGMMMHGGKGQQQNCPCLANGADGKAAELITEDKAKEAAQTYIDKYLSGYAIEKVEKDDWRPMYLITIKGANDVQQKMLIQGFSGQVMHVFPVTE